MEYVCVCIHTYVCMYTYIHVCVYIHIHIPFYINFYVTELQNNYSNMTRGLATSNLKYLVSYVMYICIYIHTTMKSRLPF